MFLSTRDFKKGDKEDEFGVCIMEHIHVADAADMLLKFYEIENCGLKIMDNADSKMQDYLHAVVKEFWKGTGFIVYLLAVMRGGGIIGVIRVSNNTAHVPFTGLIVEFSDLYVIDEFRNCGVARELIKQGVKIIEPIKYDQVRLSAHGKRLSRAYSKLGFKEQFTVLTKESVSL